MSFCCTKVIKPSVLNLHLNAYFINLWIHFSSIYCFSKTRVTLDLKVLNINKPFSTALGSGTSCHFINSTHSVMIQIKQSFHSTDLLWHLNTHLKSQFILLNVINLKFHCVLCFCLKVFIVIWGNEGDVLVYIISEEQNELFTPSGEGFFSTALDHVEAFNLKLSMWKNQEWHRVKFSL